MYPSPRGPDEAVHEFSLTCLCFSIEYAGGFQTGHLFCRTGDQPPASTAQNTHSSGLLVKLVLILSGTLSINEQARANSAIIDV